MKTCMGCKFAQWDRTAAGKLHPSGQGRCGYKYKLPPLPGAFYWATYSGGEPRPHGGFINRRKDLDDHCTHYQRATP